MSLGDHLPMRRQCPTCLERIELPEVAPGTRPCEACGKKPQRFTYFDRENDVVISWCEDVQCMWEAADLLGVPGHRLSWCACAELAPVHSFRKDPTP